MKYLLKIKTDKNKQKTTLFLQTYIINNILNQTNGRQESLYSIHTELLWGKLVKVCHCHFILVLPRQIKIHLLCLIYTICLQAVVACGQSPFFRKDPKRKLKRNCAIQQKSKIYPYPVSLGSWSHTTPSQIQLVLSKYLEKEDDLLAF